MSPYYISKVVIDIETLEVLEKETVPYNGPWELAEEAPVIDAPVVDVPIDTPSETDIIDPPDTAVDDTPVDTPADDAVVDEPAVDEPVVEDEPDPNAPAPVAKPQTPQELAADATLKKAYRENFGQVKEVLKAHPELRGPFMKAAEINEIYTTVEDAKQAKEWATQLYKFDNLYYSKSEDDKREFLSALHENSLEPDGSSPHYDQVASMVVGDGLGNLASRIQQGDAGISRAFADLGLNGKQAMVAVQAVAAMFGIPLKGVKFAGGSAPAPGSTPGTMSEREQFLAQKVAELNAELEAGKSSTLAQTEQNFYNGIQSKFHSSLGGDIDKRLEPATALKSQKPGFQTWVKEQIKSRTIEAVRSDTFFASQMEAMSRSGNRSPEHQQQLVAALEQRARQFLPDVLRDVLGEAGITITQKTNAQRTPAGTPRREPVTSGTPGRLTKPGERQTPKTYSGGDYSRFADKLLDIK